MCLFTHFAAGALVGGATGNVYLAAAAGMASHAALDAIPHYDHPDWRIELALGVLSLILLLLMPFVTAAAVVGGLFGMVPDLENLFQKLGKMRRDQFVFPSHTGLIPHGRTLAPRSLVWQVAIFVSCFVLMGLVMPVGAQAATNVDSADAQMGRPQIRVLSATENQTRVRVDFPTTKAPADWQTVAPEGVQWAMLEHTVHDEDTGEVVGTLPPRLSLALAVPTRQAVETQITGISWWREPAQSVDTHKLVSISVPAVYRSVPLVTAELPVALSGGILAWIELEIRHPVARQQANQLQLADDFQKNGSPDRWKPQAPANLLNVDLFNALARGSRQAALVNKAQTDKAQPTDYFSLTDNWVKLEITQDGVYRLTGQDLLMLNIPTGNVDPGDLRLYRGGGLAVDLNPEYPDSLQLDRVGLTEVALELIGSNDEWLPTDEIRFYAFSNDTWLDRFDDDADRLEFYNHQFADKATYWLTWEGYGADSPLPGTPKRVVSVGAAATGAAATTTCRVRVHEEKQIIDARGLVLDNWVWDNTIISSRSLLFDTRPPAPGTTTRFVVDVRGMSLSASDQWLVTASINGDTENQVTSSFRTSSFRDSMRIRLVGDSDELNEGTNYLTLNNLQPPGGDRRYLVLDSFDVFYWTPLQLDSSAGQLEFAHWGDQVAAPGDLVDLQLNNSSSSASIFWDITDPNTAVALTGTPGESGLITYGLTRQPDLDRHFIAHTADQLLDVDGSRRVSPMSLRAQDTDVDYIVVAPLEFMQPAMDLADFRSADLSDLTAPEARAVSVDDIYNNFSGGNKDPLAIRNYLRHVYETGGHRLRYVCFLGNATRDYRNYRNRQPQVDLYDFVPTSLRTYFPVDPNYSWSYWAYATDDDLMSFDDAGSTALDPPDLAAGRLPANTYQEAVDLVQRSRDYSESTEPGIWRNRVTFTADDLYNYNYAGSYGLWTGEIAHTRQAEYLTETLVPEAVDIHKIFSAEYDAPPGSIAKPETRADINNALSAGTTIFYYVGHGAEDNLSDEQIFRSHDIANLTNGMQRFLFVAFSCDVGVYESYLHRSMAEDFLLSGNGGAIGAIAASQVSIGSSNDELSEKFFESLYPDQRVDRYRTVAEALTLAKTRIPQSLFYTKNARRYTYFGEPGTRLPHPVDNLEFASGSLDTLRAGELQTVLLEQDRNKVFLGAGDTYHLQVEESSFDQHFDSDTNGGTSSFIKSGASVFLGNGDMGDGVLGIPFKAPMRLNYGPDARIRLIASTADGDFSTVVNVPAVRYSGGANDDIVGPTINMGFSGGGYRVSPGAQLSATLSDTSSVAILGTRQNNSILLEFDDSGYMSDVTSSFVFNPNSYTEGRLNVALPADLEMGRHKVALFAGDNLGNVGSDTLSFQIVTAGGSGIASATVFPNPTPGPCRLLIELSDAMDIQWDIYTVAGHRIRTLRYTLESGARTMSWDGLDQQGDELANGTYLYVLRGSAETLARDITKTGKLVIMR